MITFLNDENQESLLLGVLPTKHVYYTLRNRLFNLACYANKCFPLRTGCHVRLLFYSSTDGTGKLNKGMDKNETRNLL